MQTARRLVELGRRVRVQTKTKTRQPLSKALVQVSDPGELEPLLATVADELNVRSVVIAGADEAFGVFKAKPDYRRLGPRFGTKVKNVAQALQADDGGLIARLLRGEDVEIDGLTVQPVDVFLTREVPEGWGVASERELTVALDLEITEELQAEGFARELVRAVQDERKEAGLDVSDRIELGLEVPDDLSGPLEPHLRRP